MSWGLNDVKWPMRLKATKAVHRVYLALISYLTLDILPL